MQERRDNNKMETYADRTFRRQQQQSASFGPPATCDLATQPTIAPQSNRHTPLPCSFSSSIPSPDDTIHLLHLLHLFFRQHYPSQLRSRQTTEGTNGPVLSAPGFRHHAVRESRLTWPFVPSQHSQPNTQSFVFRWFYIMTKEELQNYGHNKTTTTPETTKQEDFRQPSAHARFTHVHSRTRQFGECHHTHNNSHSTTLLSWTNAIKTWR